MSEILTIKEEHDLDFYFLNGEWELDDLIQTVERMIRDHGGE